MSKPIHVKRSGIHGRGVFARRRIERNEYIETFRGTRTARNGPQVLWVRQNDGSLRGVLGKNELRFLNHSQKPNAEFRGDELYATRIIPVGAEITIDYGEDEDAEDPPAGSARSKRT